MEIKEQAAKSILIKSNLPDCDFVINPYLGCGHGCAYCYARFMSKYSGVKEEWGQFVVAKTNAPDLLRKEIAKLERKRSATTSPSLPVILLSSVTDPYQPIEKKYQLTRQCLNILKDYPYPVSILTKSSLVLRDLDILKQFPNIEVGITLTTLDPQIQQKIEPAASSPAERLRALAELKKAGIATYGFFGPVLPKLVGSEEMIKSLAGKVDYLYVEVLNSRKPNFESLMTTFQKHFPKLIPYYQKTFLDKKNKQVYFDQLEKEIKSLCQKYQVHLKSFICH